MDDFAQNPDARKTVGGHERITTLSLIDESGITKRPPVYDPDKGVANHKAFLRYVRLAFEGATAEDLVAAGLGQINHDPLSREVWSDHADKIIAPGALDDGSTVVLTPAPGVTKRSARVVVDLNNRISPAKADDRIARFNRADTVAFRNAGDMLAMRTIREDFKAQVRRSGAAEAPALSDEAIDEFFVRILGDARSFSPKHIDSDLPLTYKGFDILSPATRELIANAIGVDPASLATSVDSGMRRLIADALGTDLDDSDEPQLPKLSAAMDEATPEQINAARAALVEEGTKINSHYVKMLDRALIARTYNDFIQSSMERIVDVQQQRRYERDFAERDSATVYQQKKYIPESHVEAAAQSVFATSGDFAHVEIDESVELELMQRIEAEWAILREALPHSDMKADLRFRKTGRHKAAGIYHPTKHNIAVDPRHPSSFVHEYFHHLDYTLGADADTRQLSLSEDFADILHGVQRKMRSIGGIDKLDYYTTPTEVFARGGELVCFWSGLETSLNGDQAAYDTPVYRAYEPFRERLIAWYGQRLGLDLSHEKALPAPGAAARPALSQLGESEALSADVSPQMPRIDDQLAH
jgi:hypothetical protein